MYTNKLAAYNHIIQLLIIFFIGLTLRLIKLGGPLSYDEVMSWAFARRNPFWEMWNYALNDPTPPLYYALLHFTMRLLGDHSALMRIPSVLFGSIIPVMMYWIMRLGGFSRSDGIWAATVGAVSSMLIYYSQEVRAYMMLAFFGVLSVGLLLRCFKSSTFINNLIYAITIFCLSYTHRYGLFLIAAYIVVLFTYRRWKTLGASLLISAVSIFLLVKQAFEGTFSYSLAPDRVTSLGSVIALLNMLNVGTIDLPSITGAQPAPYVAYADVSINLLVSIAGFIVFLIIFIIGVLKLKAYSVPQRQFLIILLVCSVVPSILALLAGTRFSPKQQWLLRGLIYIWPLYYCIAVAACSTSQLKRYLLILIIVINIISLYPYYDSYNRCHAATAFEKLNKETTADDLIVVNPAYFYEVVNYYYHGTARIVGYYFDKEWIDIKQVIEGNIFPREDTLPKIPPPSAKGNVYFFSSLVNDTSRNLFPYNNIFVYDDKFLWKLLKRGQNGIIRQ